MKPETRGHKRLLHGYAPKRRIDPKTKRVLPGSLLDEREIRDYITRLYRSGWSTVAIGREIGVKDNTISMALHRWGVPVRPKGSKGVKCADCGKSTVEEGFLKVCRKCRRLRNAAHAKEWRERRKMAGRPLIVA